MNQTTNKVDLDDMRTKIDKFKQKKIVISTVRGNQFLYIDFQILLQVQFWIATVFFSLFLDPSLSLSLIASFFFYTFSPFHLYPPRVGQIVSVDTCPISILLKSLCSSCKEENYCLGITSTLMRLES